YSPRRGNENGREGEWEKGRASLRVLRASVRDIWGSVFHISPRHSGEAGHSTTPLLRGVAAPGAPRAPRDTFLTSQSTSRPRPISPGEGKLPVKQLAVEALARGASLWRNAMRRLMANRMALFSLSILGALVLLFMLGPLIWPYDPNIPPEGFGAQAPSLKHPF